MMIMMMMVMAMVMIKCSKLGKEKREKQNRLKTKVYLIGPFCFAIQGTMWV
jgi:hypothetical protein